MINMVVVAHPDDEILGFGGTGSVLSKKGEKIFPIILSGEVDARLKRPDDHSLRSDIISANNIVGFEKPIMGSFPNIKMNTTAHLEIVQFIEAQIKYIQPNRIFTHHPSDVNDDHVHVSAACQAAMRLSQRNASIKPVNEFYYMEILSSTDWSVPGSKRLFEPNSFFEIGKKGLDLKIDALKCYREVMRPYPHPRSLEAISGLSAYRGSQAGIKYAEAFQLVYKRVPL